MLSSLYYNCEIPPSKIVSGGWGHVLPLYNTSAILGFEELKQLVALRPSSAVILDLNTAEKCK